MIFTDGIVVCNYLAVHLKVAFKIFRCLPFNGSSFFCSATDNLNQTGKRKRPNFANSQKSLFHPQEISSVITFSVHPRTGTREGE